MSGGGDLFGALPDELLSHVLSFLPSRDAVHTSLLSRRWRHLWRSAPAIHVRGEGDAFCAFVNSLLMGRDAASAPPLRSFEIDANLKKLRDFLLPYSDRWEVNPQVDLWVTHALSVGRARSLTARFHQQQDVLWKPRRPLPFASPHLTTIHLDTIRLVDGQLDFSCCPALLRLNLEGCDLYGDALVSPSLERLTIDDCRTDIDDDWIPGPDEKMHTSVSTPRLRFLEISNNYDKKQFLEMMPWLTKESVHHT
ncbi:hypothetical protein VPH35_093402 [Triticum aestivum]